MIKFKTGFAIWMLFWCFQSTSATTYYLKASSASAAITPSSWNTAADGSGTNLTGWRNVGTNDVYIIPLGVDGVWTAIDTIGNSGSGSQSFTFIINGSLEIDNNDRIIFDGSANIVTFTVNGSLTVDENNGSTFQSDDIDYVQFIFSSLSSLISNNRIGINGAANCIFEEDLEFRLFFEDDVNYTFYNTAGNTNLRGLQDTVNSLTINTSGRISTLQDNILVNGTLTITAGTLACAGRTLTIGTSGTFNHSTGSLTFTSGIFNINGTYTHSSGTFTMTGSASVNIGATGTLHLNSGVFDMLGRTLTVAGDITRNIGFLHFSSGLGQITFTNTVAKTLPINLFLRYPENFRLNGAGGITLAGKSGVLKDSVGAVIFTSGNLTITTDTTCIKSISGTGGRFIGNESATFIFYGTNTFNLRFDQTTPGVTNAIKNILIQGTTQVNLSARLRIAPNGVLDVGTGCSFTTNGNLAIIANASGHARIGTVLGTFTSATGDSLQLYIPGGTRGYRLFGNPFTSALAISQFMNSSTEIDITGTGGSGNGFTNTTNNNPSAYSYNTSGNSWDAFTNTIQTIGIGAGAHILVRGIKGEGLNGSVYTPSAATIRLAGQFRSGNVVTSLSDLGFGWNLVANPYPSNIDIDQISGGNWSNVNAAIYGYDKVNKTYSAYSKNIGGAVNNLSNIIEMGSSFLAEVTSAGAASITFTESIKTSTSSTVSGNPIFTPKAERFNQFKINLTGKVGTEGVVSDECLLSFGNTSSSTQEFDSQSDAWDLGGEILNLSIITPQNGYLSINEYPIIEKQTEAIPLNVWSKNNGEYTLSFTEVSPLKENTEIWLRDKYKGEIHFIQESPYTFEINDLEESYGANRFELFAVQQSSGLSKTSPKNTLRVFPNPVDINTGKVSIYIPGEGHEYMSATIYDLSGREVYSSKKLKYETMQMVGITLPTELSTQTYIMSCETLQGIFRQQIIINNK